MNTDHTPTPWQVSTCALSGSVFVEFRDSRHKEYVAKMGPTLSEHEAGNAAFIVEACNSHAANLAKIAALREALEKCIYPNAPSADDIMILILAAGVTGETQEKFRPFVERIRTAQDTARAALAL